MRRLDGRVLLVPRPERGTAPADVLVFASDADAGDAPVAVGSLPPGHRLPDAPPRQPLELVLAEREDDGQVGAGAGPTVLRSVTGWQPADLPTLGVVLAGDLVVHPRHADVPGGRLAGDDQRLRGALRARSGVVTGASRPPRGGAAPAAAVELWWALGHDAAPQAWLSTAAAGDGSQLLGWPVLDVPAHLLGGELLATLDPAPEPGTYVAASLHGPDGLVPLRPAGRARLLTA